MPIERERKLNRFPEQRGGHPSRLYESGSMTLTLKIQTNFLPKHTAHRKIKLKFKQTIALNQGFKKIENFERKSNSKDARTFD